MPTCCILHCSGKTGKRSRLTLHKFPKNKFLKQKWVDIIGLENINFEDNELYVCSAHFDDKCFLKLGHAIRLRENSVPLPSLVPFRYQKNEVRESTISHSIMVCRTCLAMDCKLVSMNNMLEDAFEQVTGILLLDEDLPRTICVECAHRLRGYTRFRQKCLRADTLMMDIIKREHGLTISNMKSVNRQMHGLTSPLSLARYGVDHFDLYINEDLKHVSEDLTMHFKEEEEEEEEEEVEEEEEEEVDELEAGERDFAEIDVFASELDEVKIEEEYLSADDDREFAVSADDADDSQPEYTTDKEVKRETGTVLTFTADQELNENDNDNFGAYAPIRLKKVRKIPGGVDGLKGTFNIIEDMNQEQQITEFKKRMYSANYKSGKFKCHTCYKGFLDVVAYNTHMARHSTACGEYSCHVCCIYFKKRYGVLKHIANNHTYKFTCKTCPFETNSKHAATLHDKFHKGISYLCPRCPEQFQIRSTYLSHIRLRHPCDFVCQLCGDAFVSDKGRNLHVKLKHRLDNTEVPENGPWCEPCHIQFANEGALRHHEKSKHTKKIERPYSRRTRIVRVRQEVANHYGEQAENEAKGNKEIECEQCDKILLGPRAYHAHFRTVHKDKNRTKYPSMKSQHMCEVCGRIFSCNATLAEHMVTHSVAKNWACAQCGKAFALKYRYVAHVREHAGSKPIVACKLCNKTFHNTGNLYRHMYIHSAVKLFKCELCGKSFAQPDAKQSHINHVHLKVPWPKKKKKKMAFIPAQPEEAVESESEQSRDTPPLKRLKTTTEE